MFATLKSRIPTPLKKYFLSPIKRHVDDVTIWLQLAIFYPMRKVRRALRARHLSLFGASLPATHQSYNFIILCIKKTMYADLVLNNVNSLHYHNNTHHVTVQCDGICYNYLKTREYQFDYPSQVTLEKIAGVTDIADKGWQFFKVEAIINAAKSDRILFDADTFWHEDIVLDRDKITLLVENGTLGDKEEERLVIENIFGKPEWTKLVHHVAAFVSIPQALMTEALAHDMRKFNQMVWDDDLSFLPKNKQGEILRLSEELAVNLSVQTNFPPEKIAVLKDVDGTKNRHKMESLYYGCKNRINE